MRIVLLSAIAVFSVPAESSFAGQTKALLGPAGISILGQPHIPFEKNVGVSISGTEGRHVLQETFSVKPEFVQSIGKCQTVDFVIVEKANFAQLDNFKVMLVSSTETGGSICHIVDDGINFAGGDGSTITIMTGIYSKKYHNRPLSWVGGHEKDDFTDKETITFRTKSIDGIKDAELRVTCDEDLLNLSIDWGTVTQGHEAGSLVDIEHRVGKNPTIQSRWMVSDSLKVTSYLEDISRIMNANADFIIARRPQERKNGEKAVFDLSGSDYILEYILNECKT